MSTIFYQDHEIIITNENSEGVDFSYQVKHDKNVIFESIASTKFEAEIEAMRQIDKSVIPTRRITQPIYSIGQNLILKHKSRLIIGMWWRDDINWYYYFEEMAWVPEWYLQKENIKKPQ